MGDTAANVATGGLYGMATGNKNDLIPVVGSFMGNGGSKGVAKNITQVTAGTPNLYKPYEQYMPDSYFNNQPVTDPSSILAAYSKYMPQFLQASRPTRI